MEKDLTYSRNQRPQPFKEVVGTGGTIQKVPMKKWIREVVKNPNGETAVRARKKNDPDLKKVHLATLSHVTMVDPEEIVERMESHRPQVSPQTDLTCRTLDQKVAKEMGFRPAEAGKFGQSNKKSTSVNE
jgi:hypothetical protein